MIVEHAPLPSAEIRVDRKTRWLADAPDRGADADAADRAAEPNQPAAEMPPPSAPPWPRVFPGL
jgi:hypothetical protein